MEQNYVLQENEPRLHVTVHYFSCSALVKTNEDWISTTIKSLSWLENLLSIRRRQWSSLYALIWYRWVILLSPSMYVLSIVLRHSSLRMYDKALETSVAILFFTNNLNHNELCMIYNALQDTWYYHSCSFHSTLSSVANNSWNMCKYLNS